ncbi:HPr family phosphocarrier protein [Pseudidiomarina taiwanensis]|uniref:HPr family phosphocarrier protein n=1 Tax=Pseudidiomarina taiwanensis TaxID=337250 RepID=A0A432ZLY7_9GAMM|nr:HPr family phosphocarrier protein [Pseudidiomarina taiwanensis]RUO78572.1 HPr family phosphocarrier protein [Pseudidiomarina taiwanensis]
MKVSADVVIRNKLGLHARAATKLAKLTQEFDAKVEITQGEQTVNAASVMCLLLLASGQGRTITVSAEGPEAEQAVQAITALIADRFAEEQ